MKKNQARAQSSIRSTKIFLVLFTLFFVIFGLRAQVTIGSDEAPASGALLQLKDTPNVNGKVVNATKGFGMPRVELTSETNLFPMYASNGLGGYTGADKATEDLEHTGLMVYNLNDATPFSEGVYVWDGGKWLMVGSTASYCPVPGIASPAADVTISSYNGFGVNLTVMLLPNLEQSAALYEWFETGNTTTPVSASIGSDSYKFTVEKAIHNDKVYYCRVTNECGNSVTSSKFTIEVHDSPDNYLPDYNSGASLTGRTCFDINKSNFGFICGESAARAVIATDFMTLGGVPYVFTAPTSGTTKNLRFVVVDEEGCVQNYNSGNILGIVSPGSTSTLTVFYKTTLNRDDSTPLIVGRSSSNAAKVHIYAIYNYDNNDITVKLTASIQDCACCTGAYAQQSEYVQKSPGYLIATPNYTNFTATGQNLCIAKNDAPVGTTWNGAMAGCQSGLLSDGSTGWRLPNFAELSVMHGLRSSLADSPGSMTGTTNMSNNIYWSSSEYNYPTSWGLSFNSGSVMNYAKDQNYAVRCVRSF